MKDLSPENPGQSRPLSLGDVWKHYEELGHGMPQEVGSQGFSECLDMLGELNKQTPYGKQGARLETNLLYELGIAEHVDNPAQASAHFSAAASKLRLLRPQTPLERVRHTTLAVMTKLLLARTDSAERRFGNQRNMAIEALGELVTNYARLLPTYSETRRIETYGALVETAFHGTILAMSTDKRSYIGTPTTSRQDRPTSISFKDGQEKDVLYGTDINLYMYKRANIRPSNCARLQAKASDRRERDQSHHYHEDIVVLYANRDLFVGSIPELEEYGTELAAHPSSPSEMVQTAASNLDLYLSLRDRHFQSWGTK